MDSLLAGVLAARQTIAPYIYHTPLAQPDPRQAIYYKMEAWQKTGSFKIRGALNAILSREVPQDLPFVAASAGNHGLGVAFAASISQRAAHIFVPKTVSPAKLEALHAFGVKVTLVGEDYDEAEAAAMHYSQEMDFPFVHAFADPQVIFGQGTIGLEIAMSLPSVQQVLVPVGGGGLISGVAIALKHLLPGVEIIGIQSEASPAMVAALRKGQVVETPVQPSLADGLAGRFVHPTTLKYTQKYVDEVVLVQEETIKAAIKNLLSQFKYVVEGSAVVGLAALMEAKVSLKTPCVIVLTGSNIALKTLQALLEEPG
ncbi:MAG: threonine/serine dehydratase [Calditrichaeota bacterium]|nr:MAG: threonine/serine dehydratase [Calditrichota bacterium]